MRVVLLKGNYIREKNVILSNISKFYSGNLVEVTRKEANYLLGWLAGCGDSSSNPCELSKQLKNSLK